MPVLYRFDLISQPQVRHGHGEWHGEKRGYAQPGQFRQHFAVGFAADRDHRNARHERPQLFRQHKRGRRVINPEKNPVRTGAVIGVLRSAGANRRSCFLTFPCVFRIRVRPIGPATLIGLCALRASHLHW